MGRTMNVFQGQRAGEEVVIWIEKHWIKYVRTLTIIVLAGFLPGIVVYGMMIWLVKNVIMMDIAFSFLLMYELFVVLHAFVELLNDELDLFIITNERIVDITQVSLLQRTIADTPIRNIQDVSAKCSGFLATILNYGSITVQTAGKSTEFTMNMVKDPFGKSKKILSLINIQKHMGTEGP